MSQAHIPSIPPGVTLTTLDNGLTIIVREDHSAPVVSAQAWAMTGSIHEGRWLGAGLSHVLEHMLFKGTTTRPGSRIDQEVQEAGGYMNAYTSFDRTVYHIDVPNTGARVAIDILCDIMQHASLPPDELAKELDVIRREMDMGQDDPGRRSGRRLFETAYTQKPLSLHRHRLPRHLQRTQARRHPRLLPRKIRAEQRLLRRRRRREARRGRRANPRRPTPRPRPSALPPVVLPDEPRQTAAREIIEEAPIELGHFHFAWHIPELRHPDVPVLDVLAVLLGSGRSSRLYQQVREKQGLVHHADAWTYSPGNPGLFGMSAVVDADKFDRRPRRHAGRSREAESTRRCPPSELQQGREAIHLRHAGHAQDHARPGAGPRRQAGSPPNDLNFSERYLAAVKRVTPADLQRVARAISHAGKPHALRAAARTAPRPKPSAVAETNTEHADPEIRPAQRPAPAGEGRSSPAVRGIPRRVPRRRAGRNRGQQRHHPAAGQAAAQGHHDAQRRTDRHAKSNPSAAASTATAATTASA